MKWVLGVAFLFCIVFQAIPLSAQDAPPSDHSETLPGPLPEVKESPEPETSSPKSPEPATQAPSPEPEKSQKPSKPLPDSWQLKSWELNGPNFEGKVVVLKIGEKDLMNAIMFNHMHRIIKKAAIQKASAIIFEMDTPGGEAWRTSTLMNLLLDCPIPTITFINRRAISAGALISIATDRIYMTPGSVIGAATPVSATGLEIGEHERAKLNSALMALARSAAQAKGYHPEIADAFSDKDSGLNIQGEEIWPKGKPLTLDDQQAIKQYGGKPLLATAVVSQLSEIIQAENLSGEIITVQPSIFENLAQFVTAYSWIFIIIGIWGIMTEIKAPGFGLPGLVGGLAILIFFLAHYVTGYLPGLEWVALFLLGITLIAVEFFLFPGTFIAGILGVICLITSLLVTMGGASIAPEYAPDFLPELGTAVFNLTLGLAGAVVLMIAIFPFLPKVPGFSWLSLNATVGNGNVQNAHSMDPTLAESGRLAPGTEGVTLTELRPVGNARFGNLDLEVTAGDSFIDAGIRIRVVRPQFGIYFVEAIEHNKPIISKDVKNDPSVLG